MSADVSFRPLAARVHAAPGGPTASERLARWVSGFALGDVDAEIVDQAKLLMLDTIGVGVLGTTDELRAVLARWTEHAGTGGVSALGMARRLSPMDAGLVNGTLTHALDYDDGGFGGHPSVTVLPAALAAAEMTGASNADILAGYLVGIEIFGQLANVSPLDEMHNSGFHPTPVFGLLAATAAAGRAMGASAEELAHAFCVAAASGAGLTASFGSMVKPLHAGLAVASALRSVLLVRSGVRANLDALEAGEGYGTAYMDDNFDWDDFLSRLGRPLLMGKGGPTIKPYASCSGNHGPVYSIVSLMRDHRFTADDIASVEIHANPLAFHVLRFEWPENHYQSKFSLAYSVAATLAYGAPQAGIYTDAMLHDPRIVAARERVVVKLDPQMIRKLRRVVCNLRDGRRFETRTGNPIPGSRGNALGRAGVIAKFKSCVDGTLSADTQAALIAALDRVASPDSTAVVAQWARVCREAAAGPATVGAP